MRYLDGQDAKLGDIVEIGGDAGKVVMLIREGFAADGFTSAEWSYLQNGVLVETEWAGLIHFPEERGNGLHLKARSNRNDQDF